MMIRSICPFLAACTPLAPESSDSASNSSCRASCSTRVSRSSASSSTIRIFLTFDMAGWPPKGQRLPIYGEIGHWRLKGQARLALWVIGERPPLDHDDFGSIRYKIINVINSNSLEHDVVRKPLHIFRHHALGTMPVRPLVHLQVHKRSGSKTRGILRAGSATFPVALGRSGILANKFEGDGGTPRGSFRLKRLWWRKDRITRPRTALPVRPIRGEDAWSEDPADRRYNRPVIRQAGEPGDRLMREDGLYDLIIEIDHNDRPRVARRGSAVFIHVARPGFERDRRLRRAAQRRSAEARRTGRAANSHRHPVMRFFVKITPAPSVVHFFDSISLPSGNRPGSLEEAHTCTSCF